MYDDPIELSRRLTAESRRLQAAAQRLRRRGTIRRLRTKLATGRPIAITVHDARHWPRPPRHAQ